MTTFTIVPSLFRPIRSLRAALLVATAIAIITPLSPASSIAQCPSGWTPGAGSPFTATIPGTNCDIDIYYCTRNDTEFWISKIIPQSTDCDSINPELLIYDATNLIFQADEVNGLVPCNKGITRRVVVSRAACWGLIQDPNVFGYAGCDEVVACKKTCEVCGSGQGVTVTNCTSEVVGLPDCLPIGSDGPTWVIGHCYVLDCQ
jgi:hypothetical protein